MPYMDSMRQITVGQPVPHDASRRAGSAGVSAPLAEFYIGEGEVLEAEG
jgi:hypothetical protein